MFIQRRLSVFRLLSKLALSAALLYLAGSALVVPALAERLPTRTYTVADGLPRDNVTRIRRDSQGFLWFCTGEGVARFDGVRMNVFTSADGLPDQSVEDVIETSRGKIFIATAKGLALLMPFGQRGSSERPLFRVFRPVDPQAVKIQILYEDRQGRLWAGTTNGLYQIIYENDNATFIELPLGFRSSNTGGAMAEPAPNTISVTSIAEDSNGSMWVGTFGGGVFRFDGERLLNRISVENGLPDTKVTDVVHTADGKIWVSMRSDQTGGICEIDPQNLIKPVARCFSEANGLSKNWIRDSAQTTDGQMWLAMPSGVCRFSPESTEVCRTFAGDSGVCDTANALAEDRDGNLWIASACGVMKVVRDGFVTFDSNDGLLSNDISAIGKTTDGQMFVVPSPFRQRSISLFTGNRFETVVPRLPAYVDYHGWGWRQTVLQDKRGRWWIPSGYGAFVSGEQTSFPQLGRATLKNINSGKPAEDIFRLFEDSRGDMWMSVTGPSNELRRWERSTETWHDLTTSAEITNLRLVTAFAEDRHGNIWIGASSDHGETALIRWRNGELTSVTQKNGGPSGWIEEFLIDHSGRLWIASTGDGVWLIGDPNAAVPELQNFGTARGISASASCLTEDEFGRIYIGTWRGIERLDPQTGLVEKLTTNDGLPTARIQAAFRDQQGFLWFGTERGAARFRPKPPRERNSPITLITGVRVAGIAQSVSVLGQENVGELNLRSDQREVMIEFIGLGPSLGENIVYEYRFDSENWISATERTLNFANLAAGEYRVEIRGRSSDGNYGRPATVAFEIAVPFWQQWWFLLLAAAAIAVIVYTVYKFRLRQMIAIENVRTRIATDLHDDIGANLTRISLLSEVARQSDKPSDSMLGSIADIARESVSSMNDIVWAISPDNDSGLDLARRMRLHAEELFSLRDIDLEFEGPPADKDLKLDVGLRRDVLLIFKEAVSNAAKHSGCTRVSVQFSIMADRIVLRVADNGRGFDADATFEGQGLRSMARRSQVTGGKLSVDSSDGGGTTVIFEAPIR